MRPILAALMLSSCAASADPGLPPLPPECRVQRQGGVVLGDPLEAAVLRLASDRALLNARLAACAAWYDALRARAA